MSVFAYEPDLIFSSKLESLSHLIDRDLVIFNDLASLLKTADSGKPAAFIINLDKAEPEGVQKVVSYRVPILGYYSHTNSEIARMAVSSGVGLVVTRRAFVASANELFRELLTVTR